MVKLSKVMIYCKAQMSLQSIIYILASLTRSNQHFRENFLPIGLQVYDIMNIMLYKSADR